MASRINIGPEDGPYVAINESSGNLQLEDNSGNVVAEWDETNGQWDFANNTLNNVDALNSDSVNTDGAVIDATFFASTFDGEDADSRLADAVSNLGTEAGKLILEQHQYQSDITLQERNRYAGQWGRHNSGCRFNSEVTTGPNVYIKYVGIDDDGEIIVDGPDNMLSNIVMRSDGDITVQDDRCVISSVTGFGGTITFESDTENGEIGVVSGNTTVTDNGNNSIL